MLIQFSVCNFKTFREKTTLSFVASNYDKATREDDNVIPASASHPRLLKSAVVYGANASGKTKLIEALLFMRLFVRDSSVKQQVGEHINVEPFALNTASESEPSEFEVVFTEGDVRYRYGFEVDESRVLSEWLYHIPKREEVNIFFREGQSVEVAPRLSGAAISRRLVRDEMLKENTLLLSLSAQFNDVIATKVVNWFKRLQVLSGLDERGYIGYTAGLVQNAKRKDKVIELFKAADTGIEAVAVEHTTADELSEEDRKKVVRKDGDEKKPVLQDVVTTHPLYNHLNERVGDVEFSLFGDESAGTRKYFALSGPVVDVLQKGFILFVDELDARLHPNLVCRLIELFNSKEHNPNNAQLVFNTHDTNLLSSGFFRRDQIWFTEKDRYGAATLYSLQDFKARAETDFEKNYIQGRYGAVPYLGDFERLMKPAKTQVAHENEG